MNRHKVKTEIEWLQLRQNYITATEVASVLGLNRWQSAKQMWENKVHRNFTGNAYTYIGQLLEPVVVRLVNDTLHRNFISCDDAEGKVFLCDNALGLGASPDAEDDLAFLECKTAKPENLLKYSIIPPEHYVIQTSTQLLLDPTKKYAYLAFLGTDLTQLSPEFIAPVCIYRIDRSNALESLIKEEVSRFWKSREDGKMFKAKKTVKNKARILCRFACSRLI